MSKLFSKVRKDDKDKQQADDNNTPQPEIDSTLTSQMDALMLQDYQAMQLEQFERLVIVGMCHAVGGASGDIIHVLIPYRYWYIWPCVPGASQTHQQVLCHEDTQKD